MRYMLKSKHKPLWMAASLLAAILLFSAPTRALEVSAHSAVVLDGSGGRVLWEKNADSRGLIASTTKIMTALVVLAKSDIDVPVTIPPEAQGIEGSSMYLNPGELLTIRDLLHGLMLSSGNDAAVALAVYVSGSVEAFAEEMNRMAEGLGIQDIHFANPHGLDDPGNYATARSLGLLAAAAMENPEFRAIVSAKSYRCGDRYLVNHNKLLWQYPGAMGVKTGYTRQAGRILVGCAERGGRRVITVTMNAPNDWEDHRRMLDYGFSQYETRTLLSAGEPVGTAAALEGSAEIPVVAGEAVEFPMLAEEQAEIRVKTAPVFWTVAAGETVGTVEVYVDGRRIAQVPAVAGKG